jgi:exopolysaccharide biosynthesis predicted pyruvyltransferase EpsI
LSRLGVRVAYTSAHEHTQLAHIRRLRGVPILFQGGGNFGDLWAETHAARLDLIRQLPDRRILVLPQSVHFGSPLADRETVEVLTSHPDCTLLVRDQPSLEWAATAGVRAELVPDAAFAVGPGRVPRVARRSGSKVVALWRTDTEVRDPTEIEPEPDGLVRLDWPVQRDRVRPLLRVAFRLQRSRPGSWAPVRRAIVGACDAMARRELRRGLGLLGDAPVLVTDRLHAAVLGLMSGRDVRRVDNSYGKLANVLDLWWPEDPRLTSAATRSDAETWASRRALQDCYAVQCPERTDTMDVAVLTYRTTVAVLAAIGTCGVWLFLQMDQLRYFTTLTGLTILGIMVWTIVARLRRRNDPPAWATGAVTFFAVFTGLVAWFVLGPGATREGAMLLGLTDGQVMHQVLPVAVLVDFVLFVPHRRLRLLHGVAWAAVPVGYLVLSVLAGVLVHSGYPYWFIDVGALGWPEVLANLVVSVVGALGVAAALVGLDHGLRPRALVGRAGRPVSADTGR